MHSPADVLVHAVETISQKLVQSANAAHEKIVTVLQPITSRKLPVLNQRRQYEGTIASLVITNDL